MSATFLSDDWFRMLDEHVAQAGDLAIAPALQTLVLNLCVTEAGDGANTDIRLDGGLIRKGHVPDALAKMTMPAATARRILMKWDQAAGMSAMLGGKMTVEGNRMKLMALQTTRLSPQHKQVLADVDAKTT
ncbi:MAG TPA: SCP-2 sterol transfer family protein [Nevskiaceae bacterium]|nr:SCP-2 sterol transfer family protein [Nevskiaceae bacterium]